MIERTGAGVACEAGGFVVDPARSVPLAVVTRAGPFPACARFVCAREAEPLLRRLVTGAVEGRAYGERFELGGVTVSLHPSGHALGGAQVRIERAGEVALAIGPHKRVPDPTCAPFEVVRADVLAIDSKYGLPIYRWDPPGAVAREIVAWWEEARAAGLACVACVPLGTARRLVAELGRVTKRRVLVHPEIARFEHEHEHEHESPVRKELLVVPDGKPAAWRKAQVALVSGAARVRGQRRRRSFDRGFAFSDHADWPALLATVADVGARRVLGTGAHGAALERFVAERA